MKLSLPLTTLITSLSIACGFLFLAGLWSGFHIDTFTIIQFATISDIFKASLLPLLTISLIVGFEIISFEKRFGHHNFDDLEELPRIGRKGFIFITLLVFICGYFLNNSDNYPYISTFAVLILTAIIFRFIWNFNKYFKLDPRIKHRIIFIFSLIPTLSYSAGIVSMEYIKKGDGYLVSNKSVCDNKKYLFIASYSEKIFGYSKDDSSICIFPLEGTEIFKQSKQN
ncbi:Uncharacterised protein [Serratia marcescens]|uniref:hypothetical protein n=1 Tax=Serratia marcescens TaxID=615 RepID=UPI0021795F46|nr:hypothetical protein [Serratia marcescens]CAI1064919.1 Uncharacterised protein [Serratia marcescens]CAI1067367.1 Uncharacterised protein [Serratia marcescens]